jgi:hypothetical protein
MCTAPGDRPAFNYAGKWLKQISPTGALEASPDEVNFNTTILPWLIPDPLNECPGGVQHHRKAVAIRASRECQQFRDHFIVVPGLSVRNGSPVWEVQKISDIVPVIVVW